MNQIDSRQVSRDSLFLLAQLRVRNGEEVHRVKVRNLSPAGMMAEGEVKVSRGELVSVDLRNIGWVEGTVAWRQENRFGIAFLEQIEARRAHEPLTDQDNNPPGPADSDDADGHSSHGLRKP